MSALVFRPAVRRTVAAMLVAAVGLLTGCAADTGDDAAADDTEQASTTKWDRGTTADMGFHVEGKGLSVEYESVLVKPGTTVCNVITRVYATDENNSQRYWQTLWKEHHGCVAFDTYDRFDNDGQFFHQNMYVCGQAEWWRDGKRHSATRCARIHR